MIAPNWSPDPKQLRQFAVISLFGFGLMGVVARFKFDAETVALVFWALAVVVFLVGLVRPRLVLPVYLVMMAIATPIGWLVSNLLLRAMYYLVFTPAGLVSRALGRDPLKLKKPNVDSYWVEHEQRTDPASYYRQA